MHAIEAVALTKSFDSLTAVDGLNLTVEEGEIFGLVGPDGAGKRRHYERVNLRMTFSSVSRLKGFKT